MAQTNSPFFIVGVHRSGTTLLRYMLSSSSRIYIPPESDFIPRFFLGRSDAVLSERKVEELLESIFSEYRFVRDWRGERPPAGTFFQQLPAPTPTAFLHRLYAMYAEQNGAVRWGDKTPIYTDYIPLLKQLFPDARFIHIIRDGRDAALSMLDKWEEKEFHVDIFFAARNWVRRIRKARADGQKLGPAHYYELRYEDLVSDPEPQLRKVCRFLDEPFDPGMLSHHRLARSKESAGGFHDAVRSAATTRRVARWTREMDEADRRLFQAVGGALLDELDYGTEDLGGMGTRERLRLAALASKYVVLQTGRWGLQAAGLKPPI